MNFNEKMTFDWDNDVINKLDKWICEYDLMAVRKNYNWINEIDRNVIYALMSYYSNLGNVGNYINTETLRLDPISKNFFECTNFDLMCRIIGAVATYFSNTRSAQFDHVRSNDSLFNQMCGSFYSYCKRKKWINE